MAEVIVRIGIAVVALAIVAGLAVQLRAHDLLANAADVATQPHPSRADVDRQLKDMKTVSDLRPGSQGQLAAAALELRTGRYAAASRAALAATRREPRNFSAWVTLAVAEAQSGNKAGSQLAYARAHLLNPLYPIPRS
jgi:predicted Zn-dependent protease